MASRSWAVASRIRVPLVRTRRACFFFFQAEDGIRDVAVTGVQTCALPILVDNMAVRLGRAPVALRQAVADLGAELVVLGGKHHSALGRWLGGSTSLNVARTKIGRASCRERG